MLQVLLFSVLQTQAVFFVPSQNVEAVLLHRYVRTLNIGTSMRSSAGTSVTMDASSARASEVLASFSKEFHVSYSQKFPSSIVQDIDCNLSAHIGSKPGIGALADYDRDSLVVKAFQGLEELDPAIAHERLLACRYCLRPWITSKLKRTETISAVFTFLHQGKRVEYRFTYDGA